MAVLDAAISHPRQIRGSSPRMTNYKTVMAVLDTAIFFHAADARIKSAHDVTTKPLWPDLIGLDPAIFFHAAGARVWARA